MSRDMDDVILGYARAEAARRRSVLGADAGTWVEDTWWLFGGPDSTPDAGDAVRGRDVAFNAFTGSVVDRKKVIQHTAAGDYKGWALTVRWDGKPGFNGHTTTVLYLNDGSISGPNDLQIKEVLR